MAKEVFIKRYCRTCQKAFPDIEMYYKFDTSFITPDGGFLSIVDKNNNLYPILIPEVKNQGTNDLRRQEGLPKQAQGNAIERLGKNVIGLRTYFLTEIYFLSFILYMDVILMMIAVF